MIKLSLLINSFIYVIFSIFQVTMLSNHDLDNPKIKHHRHGVQETNWDNMDTFGRLFNPHEASVNFGESFWAISKKMYDDPTVKMLYEGRREYDLIVLEDALNRVSEVVHVQVY